jgi:Yaf2/RYBP C-terminal binding motif
MTPSSESQRLKNIDRCSGVSMEVTVNGVTVVVTDYKPKSTVTPGSSSRSRMLTDINAGRDLASFPSAREQPNISNVANSSSSSLTHSFTDDSHNDIVSD